MGTELKKIFDEFNQEYEKRMDLQEELNLLMQKVGNIYDDDLDDLRRACGLTD